jgi:hypothetical protein
MKGYKLFYNVKLLYFIFLISILNMIWFIYYNQRCILIYVCLCLAIYLINQNMIFVLGISLILVDSFYILNLVKTEGFWGDKMEGFDMPKKSNIKESKESKESNENYKNYDMKNAKKYNEDDDISLNSIKELSKNKENFLNLFDKDEGYESDTSNKSKDEESNYMHDKSIINKLKQLDPIILNTIENMNSVHIKEINKTINSLTNKIDS